MHNFSGFFAIKLGHMIVNKLLQYVTNIQLNRKIVKLRNNCLVGFTQDRLRVVLSYVSELKYLGS